ncbi:MAG: acyl-[ACP]--phospholipid O-acyltransferase [Candidatus Sumerlaeota bacterium]|nr:acyl-[ACP]--phospholipid O-acyltransferase [Candidatus Sumerlaeota bacterium]
MAKNAAETRSLKGFWALIVAQFQAAFNDNAYENLLMTLAAFGIAGAAGKDANVSYVLIVFTLPFMFSSPYGGQLADRFSKRSISILVKIGEIGIMLAAAAALFWAEHLWLSLCILGLMGVRAGIFGPSKYGIIPEIVPEKKLSWANGVIELTTFVAIMGGTICGIFLYDRFKHNLPASMIPLLMLSFIGAAAAFGITRVPAASPDRPIRVNAISELWRYAKYARADRVLWLAVLGNTYFWFAGALVYQNVVVYAKHALGITEANVIELTYLRLGVTLGIGLGSYLAGVLSGGKIEYGLVPLGALVLALSGAYLSMPGVTLWPAVAALAMLGLGGGFFLVPVQALVQHRPDPRNKGGVQGMTYFLTNAASMSAGVIYLGLCVAAGLTAREIFLVLALMTAAVSVYLVWLLPDSLLRLVLWMLTNTIYRIRILGRDNIPERGGALFVSNHLSFADALFIIASTDRHVRFIMLSDYYNHRLIHLFARIMRAIPISSESGPRALLQALREASETIRGGDVVCIFAEGEISRTGQMLPFRRGFERIMKNVDAPIVPVHLDRVWGSVFSFEKGRFLWKWPHRLPYPITVSFGQPLSAGTQAPVIRRAVQELSVTAAECRRDDMRPLHREFIRTAKRFPRRFAMADDFTPHVTFRQALARNIILGRKLRAHWQGQDMVGLLMPPSVAGACLNIAALMCGRTPVNLNYTAPREALASATAQCGIRTIVTARAFLEKIRLEPLGFAGQTPGAPAGKIICIEDIAAEITWTDKTIALLAALFFPARLIEKMLGCARRWTIDDMATVIFSSGSTGDPKGVMLSHYNILSNIEGVAQVMAVTSHDRILGVLPFFHSFGFTGTLWFPLVRGFGVVYHPNPMDARIIGGLVSKHMVTLMVATPTFMQSYIRRVAPGQFGSLRFVLAGAEKLPDRIALAFEDRFGIRPYEAYGATECSPAVAINVPGFRAAGFYQAGCKRAHIGHPLPGVAVSIVDPETFKPLPNGQPGLLLVKGPNVMMGYLVRPDLTSASMHNGWYVTGDIASMDDDGFLAVTDRLSRFSKIGGEMVPHIRIEETLHELAGVAQQVFAVSAVPDERKNERLAVLHTLDDDALRAVLDKLPACGLPNLWIPRANAFFRVAAIPVLGTGKTDLRKLREMALALSAARS